MSYIGSPSDPSTEVTYLTEAVEKIIISDGNQLYPLTEIIDDSPFEEDRKIEQKDSSGITPESMSLLDPPKYGGEGQWLNDEIINGYIKLVEERNAKTDRYNSKIQLIELLFLNNVSLFDVNSPILLNILRFQ